MTRIATSQRAAAPAASQRPTRALGLAKRAWSALAAVARPTPAVTITVRGPDGEVDVIHVAEQRAALWRRFRWVLFSVPFHEPVTRWRPRRDALDEVIDGTPFSAPSGAETSRKDAGCSPFGGDRRNAADRGAR